MTSDKTTTDKSSKVSTILLPVFVPAVLVIALMVIGTMSNPKRAGAFFTDVLAYVTTTFGWFYMLAVAIFLVFIVSVAFSSWGILNSGLTMPSRSTASLPGSPCCFLRVTASLCCSLVWLSLFCTMPRHPMVQD